jgi:hypothetical protein
MRKRLSYLRAMEMPSHTGYDSSFEAACFLTRSWRSFSASIQSADVGSPLTAFIASPTKRAERVLIRNM